MTAGAPAPDVLQRLTQISRALTYARSLDEVLGLTVEYAADLLNAPRAVLLLTDPEGLLRIRASKGVDEAIIERFREPLDENLASRLSGVFGEHATPRFLGVPLVVEGSVTGVLGVRRREEDGPPGDEEEWLLSALADQVSIALEGTRQKEIRSLLEGRLHELERQRRGKDQAIEIMSHDLRSPLNAMLGYLGLLDGGVFGAVTDRQKEILERMRVIGNHLHAVLENVLEMARLTSGRVVIESRPIALDRVVEEALVIVRPAAEDARIAIERDTDPDIEVVTDGDRLRQVLVQLLDNAIKYSAAETMVCVRTRASQEGGRRWADIMVIDQGPGIEPERQQSIFEPYVRGTTGREREQSGIGLGLAIATGLTRRLGGMLLLESEPDRGSTFRIRLPLGSASI